MSNVLPADTIAEILAGARAGLSQRAISRLVGVSTNTIRRYYPAYEMARCSCGAPAGHKGWCRDRYAKSPARQAFHAGRRGVHIVVPEVVRRSRIKEVRALYDFVFGIADDWRDRATPLPREEHYGVIGEVHASTRRVSLDHQDDVRQAMILAVYEGRIQRREISDLVGAFVKFEMLNTIGAKWSLYVSLHAPMGAGDMDGGDHLSQLSALDEDGVWRGHPSSLTPPP